MFYMQLVRRLQSQEENAGEEEEDASVTPKKLFQILNQVNSTSWEMVILDLCHKRYHDKLKYKPFIKIINVFPPCSCS